MTQRINYFQQSPELTKKLIELDGLLQKTTIEAPVREGSSLTCRQSPVIPTAQRSTVMAGCGARWSEDRSSHVSRHAGSNARSRCR